MDTQERNIVLRVLGDERKNIAYRPKFARLAGSVTAAILLQQIYFRYVAHDEQPFYKFKEPCPHPEYKKGDSWCEELGFTRREFDAALRQIGQKLSRHITRDTKVFVWYWITNQRKTYYELNWDYFGNGVIRLYETAQGAFTKRRDTPLPLKTEITRQRNGETKNDAAACERRAERDPSVVSVPETTDTRSQQPQMQGFHLIDTTPWEDGALLGYTCERYAALFAETYGYPHPRITPKKLRAIYDTLALAYDDEHLDVTDEDQVDELICAHLASTSTDGKLYAFAMLHHLGFLALAHPEQPCSLHQDFVEELGEVRRQAAERKSRVQIS